MSKNADYSKQQLKSAAIFAEAVASFGEKVELIQAVNNSDGPNPKQISAIKSAACAVAASVQELAMIPPVVRKYDAEADKESIYTYLRVAEQGWLALLSMLFGEKVEAGNILSYMDKALKPPTDKGLTKTVLDELKKMHETLNTAEREKNAEEAEKAAKKTKVIEVSVSKFLGLDNFEDLKKEFSAGVDGDNDGAAFLTASAKGIHEMVEVLNKYNFGEAQNKLKPLKEFLEAFAKMMVEFSASDPKNKEKIENYAKFIHAIDLTNTAVIGFINNIDEVSQSESKAINAIDSVSRILEKMMEILPPLKKLDKVKEQTKSLSEFFQNLDSSFKEYNKAIGTIGKPEMVLFGIFSVWSIKVAAVVLKVLHTKLAPAAKLVIDDKSTFKKGAEVIQTAKDIFKSIAVISLASVPIVLLFPFTMAAMFLAKMIIKKIVGVANLVKDNEKSIQEGLKAMKGLAWLVVGTIAVVLAIVLISKLKPQLGETILTLALFLAVMFGLVGAYILLSKFVKGDGPAMQGMKLMMWLVLGTILMATAIVLLSYIINDEVWSGFLVVVAVLFALVGAYILISKFAGPGSAADKGVKAMKWLIIGTIAISLAIVLLSYLINPRVIGGVIMALAIMFGIAGSMWLLSKAISMLPEDFGRRALGLFLLTLGLALIVVLLAVVVKPAHIFGLAIAFGGMFMLIFMAKRLNKALLSLDENFGSKALKVFIIMAALALLITVVSKVLKLEDLIGLGIYALGLFAVIFIMKLMIKMMPPKEQIMDALKIVLMFLLASLLTIAVMFIAGQLAQQSWAVIGKGLLLMLASFMIVVGMMWGLKWFIKLVAGGQEGLGAAKELLWPLVLVLAVVILGLAVLFVLKYAAQMASMSWKQLAIGLVVMLASFILVILIPKVLGMFLKTISGGSVAALLWPILLVLVVVLVAAAVMGLLLLAAKVATMSWMQILKGMVILAASLMITFLLFWLLSKLIDGKGGGFIGKLFKNMGAVGKVAEKAVGKKKKGGVWQVIKSVLKVALVVIISLGVLMLCMWAGKFFTWAQIFKGLIVALGLAVIVGSFYLLQKAIEKVKWKKLLGALILIAVMLVALVLFLIWIDNVLNWGMLSPVTLLGLIIVALAGLMILLDKMNKNKGIDKGFRLLGKIVLGMLEMSVGFFALAVVAAMYNIAKYIAVGFMCGVIYLLGEICVKLDKLNKNGGVNKGLIIMAEILLAILGMAVAFGVLAFVAQMFTLPVYIAAGFMVLVLGIMGLMAFGLGALDKTGFVTGGALVLIVLAGAFLLASLGLVAMAHAVDLFSKIKVPAWGDIARLGVFILGIISVGAAAGAVAPLLGLGSIGMTLWCAALALLGVVTPLLLRAIQGVTSEQTTLLCTFLGGLILVGSAAGLASPLLLLGAAALTVLGAALMIMAGVLSICVLATNMLTPETIRKSYSVKPFLKNLVEAVTQFGIKDLFELGLKGSTLASSIGDLCKVISKIAQAVKDFAELKVPTEWDSKGKVVGYRKLEVEDFQLCANSVSTIISILGRTIISLYKESPEIFADPWFGNNPFTTVVKSCTGIGKMVSKIAKGVKEFADLKVAVAWDKEGKPTEYRHLENADFMNAALNITTIVQLLGKTLMDLYTENPHFFKDPWFGDSPFNTMLKSTSKMGKMISDMAKGIQNFANLCYPVEWNDKGEAIDFKRMENADFMNAGMNISNIVMLIAKTLLDLYNTDTEFFEADDDSPFMIMMEATSKMGKMISDIAKGIQDFANLKIAIYEGDKISEYRLLTDEDFTSASENIKTIVCGIAETLIEAYDMTDSEGNKFFEDGDEDDSPIQIMLKCVEGMGKGISQIAKAILDYSKCQIPVYVDGKIDHYDKLEADDFEAMGTNLEMVIMGVANALSNVYTEHQEMFVTDDDDKPTAFKIVTDAVGGMSKIISEIAKSIIDYSKAMFPVYQDGKIVDYVKLTPDDYAAVGTNVGLVITNLSTSLETVYNTNKPLFEPAVDDNGNPIGEAPLAKIMTAVKPMSKFISEIAEGVTKFASATYDKYDDKGKKIGTMNVGKEEYNMAAENISSVVTTIMVSLAALATDPQWGDVFQSDDIKKSRIGNIVTCAESVSNIVAQIAQGVLQMADGVMIERDEKGNVIRTTIINEATLKQAGKNVVAVITAVLEGFNELSNSEIYRELIGEETINTAGENGTPLEKIIANSLSVISLIGSVANAVKQVSELKFKDADGKEVQLTPEMFTAAGVNTASVITSILNGILLEYAANKDIYTEENLNQVPKLAQTASQGLTTMSMGVAQAILSLQGNNVNLNDFVEMTKGTFVAGAEVNTAVDGFVVIVLKSLFKYIHSVMSFTINIKRILGQSLASDIDVNKFTKDFNQIFNLVSRTITDIIRIAGILQASLIKNYVSYSSQVQLIFDDIKNFSNSLTSLANKQFNTNKLQECINALLGTQAVVIVFTRIIKRLKNYTAIAESINIKRTEVNGRIVTPFDTMFDIVICFMGSIFSFIDSSEIKRLDSQKETFFGNSKKEGSIRWYLTNLSHVLKDVIIMIRNINRSEISTYKSLESQFRQFFSDMRVLADELKAANSNIVFDDTILQRYNQILRLMDGSSMKGSGEETMRQAQGLVKAINTLDITKTNVFIRLLQELNMLGQRMGGLDNLTKAIAQTLSSELRKLTFEISRSEFVINHADRIQEARAQRIADLIDEVRELISMPIEVRPVEEDEEDEGGGGSGGGGGYSGGISSVNNNSYNPGDSFRGGTAYQDSAFTQGFKLYGADTDSSIPSAKNEDKQNIYPNNPTII